MNNRYIVLKIFLRNARIVTLNCRKIFLDNDYDKLTKLCGSYNFGVLIYLYVVTHKNYTTHNFVSLSLSASKNYFLQFRGTILALRKSILKTMYLICLIF